MIDYIFDLDDTSSTQIKLWKLQVQDLAIFLPECYRMKTPFALHNTPNYIDFRYYLLYENDLNERISYNCQKNWLFLQKHFVVGVFSWVLNILFANKNCQIKSLRELIKLSANSGYDHTILINEYLRNFDFKM